MALADFVNAIEDVSRCVRREVARRLWTNDRRFGSYPAASESESNAKSHAVDACCSNAISSALEVGAEPGRGVAWRPITPLAYEEICLGDMSQALPKGFDPGRRLKARVLCGQYFRQLEKVVADNGPQELRHGYQRMSRSDRQSAVEITSDNVR